jgi:spore coat protein CotF
MTMNDQEYINDSVASQKLLSEIYNTYANECVNVNLRDEFLNILKEEHQIQTDLFQEMQKRGWYTVKQADQNMITAAKDKLNSSM